MTRAPVVARSGAVLPPLAERPCPECRGDGAQREPRRRRIEFCDQCFGKRVVHTPPPAACLWCGAPANEDAPGAYACGAAYAMLAPEERWEPDGCCRRVPRDTAAVILDLMAERGLSLTAVLEADADAAQLLAPLRRTGGVR